MSWPKRIMSEEVGIPEEVAERYTTRLLALVRQNLPKQMRQRVDPEDVVQSVYLSFFRRLKAGKFAFEDSFDVWRLLATMTFHKTSKAVRYHRQGRRDVRREEASATESRIGSRAAAAVERQPGPEDVAVLFESLERLLSRVPEGYRDIAVLRLEGNSIAEIATRIGKSQRTVLRSLARLEELAAAELDTEE